MTLLKNTKPYTGPALDLADRCWWCPLRPTRPKLIEAAVCGKKQEQNPGACKRAKCDHVGSAVAAFYWADYQGID